MAAPKPPTDLDRIQTAWQMLQNLVNLTAPVTVARLFLARGRLPK